MVSMATSAQNKPTVFKVKKANESFYFFQKGNAKDTISKNSGDLFYLIIKDKLKKILYIHIDNGQLLKTDNDSVFRVNYIKGIKYECFFEKILAEGPDEFPGKKNDQEKNITYNFKCMINGVSNEEKNKIVFRFKVKDEALPFLENKFFYK